MSTDPKDVEYQELIRKASILTSQAAEQSRTLVQELQLLRDLLQELDQ